MPLTTDDIAQIKEAFGIAPDSTLKETLGLTEIQKTLVSFEKKLTEVDNKLSEKLLAVETSNRELTLSIQAVKTHNEKTFAELRSADTNLEQKIESKDAQINVLTNRLHQLERRSAHNEQHGRRWNIEIDGIPVSVDDKDLERVVLDILHGIDVELDSYEIEAVHRLPSKTPQVSKPTIVRFVSRKTVDTIWQNKAKLKTLNVSRIAGLDNNSKVFFNPSLCSYYKELAYNCRKLRNEGIISKVKTDDNGIISIVLLTGGVLKVKHHVDLTDKFPDFRNFTFDQ